MRSLLIPVVAIVMIAAFGSCGGGSKGPATFCDTTCIKDSLVLTGDGPAKPFVRVSFKDCKPDSINWGNTWLPKSQVMAFGNLTGKSVTLNPKFIQYYFHDTSYVWLTFNDCATGQGFAAKMLMARTKITPYNGALNALDPKFSVADELVAWTDRGNIWVEEKATGKQALMTFGAQLKDFDYANVHASIDSVNITSTRIWAKFKNGENWEEKEKAITLGDVK
jgi:hypothetical protein